MKIRSTAIGLAALLGVFGALFCLRPGRDEAPDGSTAEPPSVPIVHVAAVAEHDMAITVRGIGQVQPSNCVQVKSRLDGPIDKILYREGQHVDVGDPLIIIDPRPYQTTVSQAEAQLAKDQSALAAAKGDLDRSTALLQGGYASRQSNDHQGAMVSQLTAAVRYAQAALDAAELNLQFATIRAPISGRIGKQLVGVGNFVRSADNVDLVEIVALTPVDVVFSVPQDALPMIQSGQRAHPLDVEVRSGDDQWFLARGQLVLIANRINPQTGTIELKAVFDNDDQGLWPGQFVNARIVTEIRRDVATVPKSAIQASIRGSFVYVANPVASTVRPEDVEVSRTIEGTAFLDAGPAAGELVVLDNQEQLASGRAVTIAATAVDADAASHSRHAEASP
jgi:multidrug efflux system membrane fusion protein